MAAAIRYSPHSTPSRQRFLILKPGHHDLRFYEVDDIRDRDVKCHQLARHTDFSNVRAFDWSPTEEAIFGVGLTTGEAALLRIDDSSNGVLSFIFKNPRPCNAVALSLNGYLAAGLDKVRNDFCLNIWDINHRLSTWDRQAKGWTSTRPLYEPFRKLAASEPISSLKFFSDQANTLVSGVKGQFVRVYDLRDHAWNPSIQFPTRCTNNISIDTQDENYFASASNHGEPTVCVWDRRTGLRSTAASMSSSSLGHGAVPGPVLEFRDCLDSSEPSSQPSIRTVRFCKSKRGAFGVLSSQGQLKVYETATEYAGHPSGGRTASLDQSADQLEHPQFLYTKRCREVEQPYRARQQGSNAGARLESFDFMSSGRSDDHYQIIACRSNGAIEALRLRPQPPKMEFSIKGEATVLAPRERYDTGHGETASRVNITPSASEGARASAILKSIRLKVARAHRSETEREQAPVLSSRESCLRALNLRPPDASTLDVSDVLSLGTVERRRAEEGYLFNPTTNIDILDDDPGLQTLWRWVQHAKIAAVNGGMVYEHIDLAFLGVHGIWNCALGRSASSRLGGEFGRQYSKAEFKNAVRAVVKHHKKSHYKGPETAHPELRQLCLGLCDWADSPQEFEAELQRLLRQESRASAAAWALFNGFPKRAIDVVLQGDDADKVVAMALAAMHNTAGDRKEGDVGAWSGLCDQIREDARDPWTRAVLAYVSTEDWKVVIEETSLPLRHRVGVALKYLDDGELTRYLSDLTIDCVDKGDTEGIVLTGITEATANLFQNYIRQRGDVQTAVLVMAHSVPLYFDDDRFRHWQANYCGRLNQYNLHEQRCSYVEQHARMSRTTTTTTTTPRSRGEHALLTRPVPPRQIAVRCNYCEAPIANNNEDGLTVRAASLSSTTLTVVESNGSGMHGSNNNNPLDRPPRTTTTTTTTMTTTTMTSDMVCPRCGRHLPRCGVCMTWLGSTNARHMHSGMSTTSSGTGQQQLHHHPAARFNHYCNMCHHGFHAVHAQEWFAEHKMCPVSECPCLCAAF